MKLIFTLLLSATLSTFVYGQEQSGSGNHNPVTIRLVCHSRAGEFPISYLFRYKDMEKFVSYKKLKKNKNNIFSAFSPEEIERFSAVKGDNAVKKFGKNAGMGVIILDLKDQADSKTWRKIKRY